MSNHLNIIGLALTFLGSLTFARGLFISKKEALELGVSRYVGKSDEENLKLPLVKERLTQRKWGITGAIFVTAGFILQFLVLLS